MAANCFRSLSWNHDEEREERSRSGDRSRAWRIGAIKEEERDERRCGSRKAVEEPKTLR